MSKDGCPGCGRWVIDRSTADDWIRRAHAVTVRPLTDEVNWVLDRRDLCGPDGSLAPPPLASPLVSPRMTASARQASDTSLQCHETSPTNLVQIGALADRSQRWTQNVIGTRGALEIADGEIRFTGPTSVVALFRDALDAFSTPGEPRWVALERLLTRVIAAWEAEPQHRDPVFARDGWRCSVPACSARRNLHDHHIQFRSQRGSNRRANRTTVCAAHHLHGIHAGVVRARGSVPTVYCELGVRSDQAPLLSCMGDRYV